MVIASASFERLGVVVVILAAWWIYNQLVDFFDYGTRAERPTQDNTIKRVAEQQGLERFNRWMAVRSAMNAVMAAVLIVALLLVYRGW